MMSLRSVTSTANQVVSAAGTAKHVSCGRLICCAAVCRTRHGRTGTQISSKPKTTRRSAVGGCVAASSLCSCTGAPRALFMHVAMLISFVAGAGCQSYFRIQSWCAFRSASCCCLAALRASTARRLHPVALHLTPSPQCFCRQHEHRQLGMPLWVPALL